MTAVGSVTVACSTKPVDLRIYFCEVSFEGWAIEWILIAACILLATQLNTWCNLFLTLP